jgi:hypothetical protein
VDKSDLIESLYWSRRDLGGQQAQLDHPFRDQELVAAFTATVDAMRDLRASGPFYPEATRTPLIDLARRPTSHNGRIGDTEHLQAILWQPPRWSVAGEPSLDFEFLARELTPTSSVRGKERVWLVDDPRHRVSLDALLVNAEDRTPIVAEIKVGDDENAELALVQALTAAAQLSGPSQRRRLHREFRDALGHDEPSRLDVYVITAHSPPRGVRPALAKRAHARARVIEETGALDRWIRRIVFLETSLVAGRPAFALSGHDPTTS